LIVAPSAGTAISMQSRPIVKTVFVANFTIFQIPGKVLLTIRYLPSRYGCKLAARTGVG